MRGHAARAHHYGGVRGRLPLVVILPKVFHEHLKHRALHGLKVLLLLELAKRAVNLEQFLREEALVLQLLRVVISVECYSRDRRRGVSLRGARGPWSPAGHRRPLTASSRTLNTLTFLLYELLYFFKVI